MKQESSEQPPVGFIRDITVRKQVENALRASEARYKGLFEAAQDAIFLLEGETFLDCNAKTLVMFGCRREEIVGQPPWRFSPPLQPDGRDSREKATEKIEAALSGVPQFFEWRHCQLDGTAFEAEVGLSRLDIDPKPLLFATVRDITERKLAEKAQQRQAEFDTLITRVLARFASCVGPSIDENIQASLQEVGCFTEADTAYVVLISQDRTNWSVAYESSVPEVPPLRGRYQQVTMGTRSWMEQRLLGGETVQINSLDDVPLEAAQEMSSFKEEGMKSTLLLPLRGLGDQVKGCIGLRKYSRAMTWSQEDVRRLRIVADAIANVLERKRVENDLYESRQMLQQILDTIPQRVFWKDRQLNYLGCNKSFANDVALTETEDVIRKNDFALPSGEELAERYRADDMQVIETGVARIGYEEPQLRSDGTTAWLRTSKLPLRDHQGRVFGVLGTYEDITARKQAENALKEAKEAAETANRAKDQFIAVLSHELRTPLTPVLAAVTAIEEQEPLSEELRSDIGLIHRNVELEARLIDDLLDVTRISQGKITLRHETVDAHACLNSVLEICENEIESKRLKIELDLEATEHHVWADSTRFRQVLWNLLKNAVKFTPKQGHITLCTFNIDGRLQIQVADTGIGIEPEAMSRIFNAFEQGEQTWTRHFGGLGLGLCIAKALVELHHGSLTAFSEGTGKGAIFTVELDTVPPAARPARPAETSRSGTPPPFNILLVEDHPDTLSVLTRLLRKWGYTVTAADSVRCAMERVAEAKIDLLVSDLGLPDGSGLDIIRELRTHHRLPGIALSGYGTDEDIRVSMDAGFTEHLTKPVSVKALRSAVEKITADLVCSVSSTEHTP